MSEYNVGKMGWRPDPPDIRDYNIMTSLVSAHIYPELDRFSPIPQPTPPSKVDLHKWASPIETQERQDCCGNAGTSIMETFYRKLGIEYILSRRFLYKVTRNSMGLHGDTGATIRDTMKAMAKFGVPLERDWIYSPLFYDVEPSREVYELAAKHQALVYYRLDPPGQPTSYTVIQVKRFLAAELPSMLGFAVFSTIPQIGDSRCDIPFPQTGDKVLGYHAVMIAGYDDDHEIGPDRGAFLIANSWSTDWGDAGYGWLPYRYILEGQACDIWSLVLAEKSEGAQAT